MIYISGPISKDPNYRLKFRAAAEQLKLRGYDVVNPAELADVLPAEHLSHEEILFTCEHLILQCDALVTLPGWEQSLGCQREVGFAEGADLIVLPVEELLRN